MRSARKVRQSSRIRSRSTSLRTVRVVTPRRSARRPAYVEFRVGDHQDELGIVDRRYQPSGAAAGPGGAIVHWHVDDLEATVARLGELGATEYQPITPRGDSGFVTASVVDPFGNVLGVMSNPHYRETVAALGTL